jgi:hypothetical protein
LLFDLNQENNSMKKSVFALSLIGMALTTSVFAGETEGKKPEGIRHLDHVFVIVMENHHISQILGNPNATFITNYAASANLANNYYGVGHPSLTNYLEIVGGSNFGIVNDNSPDWHNTNCVSAISLSKPQLEGSPNTCPIAGFGMDAATPAVDSTNEGTAAVPVYNDPIAPAPTVGKTIADQLVAARLSWKSYQENLPPYGADGVNNSDGLVSDVTQAEPGMPKLYAVKHNPFAYFANVQAGTHHDNSLKNIVGFDRLFADLAGYDMPNFALIAPNQCHDQHGRGTSEVGTGCSVDANTIAQGDAGLKTLVDAIHASPSWKNGRNALVVVWDENDYSSLSNQVLTIVDTNYGAHGVKSNVKYNHFSLLKSIEAGFGLPCLNHSCDATVPVMSDLF